MILNELCISVIKKLSHRHFKRETTTYYTTTYNYHLFTETEGNSVFCGPETAVVARGEAEGINGDRGATKLTAFPRSQ